MPAMIRKGARAKLKTMNGRMVSARSKTGDPQCSAAMSAKVNARHGNPIAMALDVANKILGKCRSMARQAKAAASHRSAGREGVAQSIEHRLAGGVDRYLTPGQRAAKAKALRSARQQAQATGQSTRSDTGPGWLARTREANNRSYSERRQPQSAAKAVGRNTPQRMERAKYLRQDRADSQAAREAMAKMHAKSAKSQPWIHTGTGAEIKGEPGNAPHARISTARHTAARMERAAELRARRKPQGPSEADARQYFRQHVGPELVQQKRPGVPAKQPAAGAPKRSSGGRPITDVTGPARGPVAKPHIGKDGMAFFPATGPARGPGERMPDRFSLAQQSAAGKKATTFTSGGGKTSTMFDMKKGDLPGQTTLMDRFGTTHTHKPVDVKAPAPKATGRNTPERAAKAKALGGMRKQYNNVRKDLTHFTAERQAKLEARGVVDESRADRLNERDFVKRQIARIRGKTTAKKSVVHLAPRPRGITAAPMPKPMPMPTIDRGSQARLELAGKIRGQRATKIEHAHPETHGKTGGVYQMSVDRIHFDPDRFQYKLAAQGSHGVTDALKGVGKFDPELAGTLSVWRDPANGKTYVVNGHHRLDLATKLGAGTVSVRYLDAANHVDARAKGALVNIAEGKGNSVDAAKFFRDRQLTREGAEQHGIPMKERIATEGLAMAGLHEKIFKRVVNHEMTPARAAIIGGSGLNHTQQEGLMKTLDKPKFRNASDSTVRNYIDIEKNAPTKTVTHRDLFGTTEEEESLGLHRATLEDKIQRRLAGDKKLFGLVSKSKAAESLAERGQSHIDLEATGKESAESGAVLSIFHGHKHLAGNLNRGLNEGAERLHAARSTKERERIVNEHYKKAVGHIKSFLANPTF